MFLDNLIEVERGVWPAFRPALIGSDREPSANWLSFNSLSVITESQNSVVCGFKPTTCILIPEEISNLKDPDIDAEFDSDFDSDFDFKIADSVDQNSSIAPVENAGNDNDNNFDLLPDSSSIPDQSLDMAPAKPVNLAIRQVNGIAMTHGLDATTQPRYVPMDAADVELQNFRHDMLYSALEQPRVIFVRIPVCPWNPEPGCVHCSTPPAAIGSKCMWHNFYMQTGELQAIHNLHEKGIIIENGPELLEFVSAVKARLHKL
ncbi:hypothetical protein QBC43DRAFT_333655 [Cladorrhinum sp. PSN259]|nr:hypothetical protein QBC43DRAFT_333655 [Cladorrhinum sp. PSN259]